MHFWGLSDQKKYLVLDLVCFCLHILLFVCLRDSAFTVIFMFCFCFCFYSKVAGKCWK